LPAGYFDGEPLKKNHVVWDDRFVKRDERNRLNNHKSGLTWLTGLSASGKSTIAHLVERELFKKGIHAYVLDGDNVRHGINSNLGFSREDRKENLRRIAELAKLLVDAGMVVLAAFISPYKEDRAYIRSRFEDDNYLEIYVRCSIGECERRDPKGQYEKARAGIIKEYTGVSSPYEEPETPDLVLDTEKDERETSVQKIIELFKTKNFLKL
jgi:adenylylsulfate kinase